MCVGSAGYSCARARAHVTFKIIQLNDWTVWCSLVLGSTIMPWNYGNFDHPSEHRFAPAGAITAAERHVSIPGR